MNIAAIDVDVQNTFTPVCPDELPVPQGHLIAAALNEQASLAHFRIMTKDAHTPLAPWVVSSHNEMFQSVGLPEADIHDAIAAGEFHKVDGVVLSQLIGDFIIELPGTRTTGPDDADVQQYQFVDGYKSNQAFAINGTIGCPSKYTLAVIDAIDKSQASTVPKPILQALLDRGVIVPRT
jgi:hypothetical protein